MKWRSTTGKSIDERTEIESLVGIPRRKFALFPKTVKTNYKVWLQYYYAVYVAYPYTSNSSGGIREHYFETFEEAASASFDKINSGFYNK